MRISAVLLIAFAPLASAFGVSKPTVHPGLKKLTEANLGKLVQLRLDIGERASNDIVSLQGPIVKFLDSVAKAIPLPVINGPNPQLSSGSKGLEVVKDGFVIDMNGMKTIPFKEGCWEMSWKDGDNAGSIVYGFDIAEPIQRNKVTIPACRVLLAFPVWTKESLILSQAVKREGLEERRKLNAEKHATMEKMQASTNFIERAFLYREAAASVEKICWLSKISHIPDDDATIELSNGLIMSTEGNLYKADSGFGMGKKLLGSAVVSLVDTSIV